MGKAFGKGDAASAAGGAGLGASLTAAGATGPWGLAGAAGGYAASKAAKAIKGAMDKRFKPIKEAKDMLAADVAALKTPGMLGLTESEINQRVSTAQQAAGAQAKASQAELARQSLAGQGFQAGAFTEAAQGVQEEAQKAGVAASARAHADSRRIQEREAARIRGDLEAARERARQAAVNTSQKAFAVVGGITSAIGLATGLGELSAVGGAIGGASSRDQTAAFNAANSSGAENIGDAAGIPSTPTPTP